MLVGQRRVPAPATAGSRCSSARTATGSRATTVTRRGDTGILVNESDRNELVGEHHARDVRQRASRCRPPTTASCAATTWAATRAGCRSTGPAATSIEGNDAERTAGSGSSSAAARYGNTIARQHGERERARASTSATRRGRSVCSIPATCIVGNTANGNGSDGITVAKGGHTLSGQRHARQPRLGHQRGGLQHRRRPQRGQRQRRGRAVPRRRLQGRSGPRPRRRSRAPAGVDARQLGDVRVQPAATTRARRRTCGSSAASTATAPSFAPCSSPRATPA